MINPSNAVNTRSPHRINKTDAISAIIIFVGATGLFFYFKESKISNALGESQKFGDYFFPLLTLGLISISALLLLIKALVLDNPVVLVHDTFTAEQHHKHHTQKAIVFLSGFAVLISLYAYTFVQFGMLWSSSLALIGFQLLYGRKISFSSLGFAILLPSVFFVLFKYLLKINLA